MSKTIYLPSAEESGKMIEDSWKEFNEEVVNSEGSVLAVILQNEKVRELAKDMFAAGYAYGNNDILSIIRGQLEAMDITAGFQHGQSDTDSRD